MWHVGSVKEEPLETHVPVQTSNQWKAKGVKSESIPRKRTSSQHLSADSDSRTEVKATQPRVDRESTELSSPKRPRLIRPSPSQEPQERHALVR